MLSIVLQASTVGHAWHRGAAAQSSPSSVSSIEEISGSKKSSIVTWESRSQRSACMSVF
jgi:hypothetical protein